MHEHPKLTSPNATLKPIQECTTPHKGLVFREVIEGKFESESTSVREAVLNVWKRGDCNCHHEGEKQEIIQFIAAQNERNYSFQSPLQEVITKWIKQQVD